ncbi:MAG: prolipoprotein diacylglyceryl transferase [Acetobacteraceae bacterium]|nr:prolipoprotein diacylglyceryl transferase [Acetobacteraceae bacterium]
MLVIPFPAIGPNAFEIGPIAGFSFAIRWYALAYIVGILAGWQLGKRLCARAPAAATPEQADDFVTWVTLGIVLGGRLGYVLFYRPSYYLAQPLEALAIWHGGMSFHGGLLGVIAAIVLFVRANRLDLLRFADRVAVVVPIGLFLGRCANFINGELWGRPSNVAWAMVFPSDPQQLPRHPSQLYQAGLEGVVLFTVLMLLARSERVRARRGLLCGVFLVGYGLARISGEFFREPDSFLGFLAFGATMGQLLSVPMLAVGLWLILRSRPR